jgi:outer membrane lipoprotein-sorting protein
MSILKPALIIVLFLFSSQWFVSLAQDSAATESVNPNTVLEKYLEAIGGKDALASVKDKSTIMRGTAMGQSITLTVKQKSPNKLRQEVKAGGMEQVIIYDGEKAVMKVMDQKIEVKDKELEALKIEAQMDFLLDPKSYGVTLSYEGNETVNGKPAYKIKMVLPSGLRWFSFFDVESGLKLKDQREIQTQMGLGEQTVTYDDYREVEGVKYPYKIVQSFGGQSVDVTVSSIKVNKGLADDIFVIAE